MPESIIFDNQELLPASWRHFGGQGPVRAFNPSLLRDGDGWVFAYRVVGPDLLRRIALCRLDRNLQVIAGSPVAFSQSIRFAPGHHYAEPAQTWFADPRLYRLAGRLFVYWNSGWHDPLNYQFIQEIDPRDLRPIGWARELNLIGPRQKLEKNWTLFGERDANQDLRDRMSGDMGGTPMPRGTGVPPVGLSARARPDLRLGEGPLYAIYSITPHRVLQFSLGGEGAIDFTEAVSTEWNNDAYAGTYGALRGGAVPQRVGEHYYSICHSVHPAPDGYRYVPAVYRFAALPPFAPTDAPTRPLALENPFGPRRVYEKLNPAVGEVIYPCGAAYDEGRWIVSYGINDEHCAITFLPAADVMASLGTVVPSG
jgi:predicted GH43/DUF377 family glycosyl hydrolase